MAIMIKYKVKEVATDLDVATKDVISVLKTKLGSDKKAMTTLTEDELNFIFDYYTQKNAVSDLSAYFAVREDAIRKKEEEAEQRRAEEKRSTRPPTSTSNPRSSPSAARVVS